MCSAINYSELSELRRDSTTANKKKKNLFSTIWPAISPVPVWQPLPGRGSALETMAVQLARRLGEGKRLPCLLSHL